MANTLMFEVGVKEAGTQLTDLEKRLKNIVSTYGKLELKVQVDGLKAFTSALENIGQSKGLDALQKRIDVLQVTLANVGMSGAKSIQEFEAAVKVTSAVAEQYTRRINEMTAARDKFANGSTQWMALNSKLTDYQNDKQVLAIYAQEQVAIKNLEEAKTRLGNTNNQEVESYQKVITSIETLNAAANTLKATLGTWDSSKGSIAQLVEQFEKLKNEISTIATTLKGIDPSKLNLSGLNINIGSIAGLGDLNSAIRGLEVSINEIIRLFSNLTNAVKLQPVDEQVKALLERCEKAEAKLREVGDAAKYLNERAGAKTQQKASTIAGIAGVDEEVTKVTNTMERYLRLLFEVENQASKIGKIQLTGESLGIDPVILRNAQTQLEGLIKTLRDAYTVNEKGEPILKLSPSEITKMSSAFSAFRAQYRDIVSEADKFNKANEKLAKQNEKKDENFAKQLANDTERATKKVAELQVKVEQYKDTVSKAQLVNAPTGQLQQYINYLQAIINKLNEIRANKGLTNTDQTLKEILNGSFGAKMVKGNYEERLVKDIIREMTKYQGKNFNPVMDALNEYKKVVNEITALQKTGKTAEKFGIDITDINNKIAALEKYRQELEQIAAGRGQRTAAELRLDKDYQNAVAAGKASAAVARNTIEKEKNSHATTNLSATEQQLANALKNSSDNMRGQSQVLSDLKMMATQYLGVWGAQGFLRNVIEIGGQLEMQRLSIGAILGDMAKATELFDRIKNLAVKSPFGVVELDQMTKQLSAYGFEYNELFDMTKRLADISAATGTSVDRLALALGHVRSEAALSGYTLRQFSMANIPLAKKLSEELTKVEGKFVSVADVRKRVRTKDIGYEQVLKVLKDLTDEGGMFYNAQEIMSESVKARFKNLKDSMDIMYGEIAESKVGDSLKGVAQLLTTLTRHWQELGAVLVAGAGYWAVNRIAMMAMSKAAVTNNIVTGQFTAKQLEAQAVTGNLTKQQLLRAVASRKMAVADAEAAANILGLTTAQLQLVRRTGDVSRAMTMATVATSKYSIAQLRFMAMFRSFSLFNLKDLFLGIASGAKAAGAAVLGLVKSFWPMLALSAVAEVFMNMKREAEEFADAANYVGQSARNLMKDIDDAISSVSKAGKPMDAEALRESVKTMKDVLEQSEYYTAEQQRQVDNAKTLSEKYDVLLKQLKEMREEAEWQTNNEGLIEKILSNTGKNVNTNIGQRFNRETGEYEAFESKSFGMSFFNDSLQENIDQVNKSNASLQSAINLLSEYQGVMDEAIRKNNGFGLSLEGKSWQEQIRLIAQSGHWDEFVASVDNAGSRFEKTADNVKKASEKVRDDWEEIVNDDVKAIRLTLMEEWGMTEDEITQFAKNNERTMRWLVDSIAKSLSKLGVAEQIIDEFKRKILELFGVASSGKPVQKELNEYQKQTDLAKRVLGNVIRHNRNNGKNGQGETTVKEINGIVGTGENVKTESDVIKALKEQAQKDHEKMKDIGRIYGETSKEYAKAKKKYEHSLNLAESNGIKESEILTGKYKDKTSGNKTDEDAKVLRERVRILKEAADSYQYWREKVGESGAETRMQGEFGQLLTEQNLQLKNADELKAKLKELREEYSKKPQTKAMVEAIKEIDKEIAKLDRKDFERDTERFLSKTQIELDNLTRSWETFNSVREATGDIELAVQLSGAEYANGKTQNLADAIREKIQKDFASVGAIPISFDINMHDEQIGDAIKAAMPKASEDQIKGFVEEYKKWRDLQRDVEQKDIDTFDKLIGPAVDLQTELSKVADEYAGIIQSLDRMKAKGQITGTQYNQAKAVADANMQMKTVQAQNEFKFLMDGVVTLSKKAAQTIRRDYVSALQKQLAKGAITAKDYADRLEEINNKMRDLENAPGYARSYMEGGLNGIFENMMNRGKSMTQQGASMFQQGMEKMGASMMQMGASMMQGAQGAMGAVAIIDTIIHGINDSVQALKGIFDEVREMFDALGHDVETDSWQDANTFFSTFSKASQHATNGWDSLKNGNIGGAIQGTVGSITSWFTGFAQGHDSKREKHIQDLRKDVQRIDNTLDLIKTLQERSLGYDRGEMRKILSGIYDSQKRTSAKLVILTVDNSPATAAMKEYYARNWGYGNGYQQELESMKQQREDYIRMYNEEDDKKKSSAETLEEFQSKIAELDEQILFFVEDLANELWGIDFKSWADQISDALWTAFENGEDALEAFHDTAKDIIADVAKKMMNIHLVEPVFQELEDTLFGKLDTNGQRTGGVAYNMRTGEFNEMETMKVLGKFFSDEGPFAHAIKQAEDFYDMAKKAAGVDFASEDSSKTTGTSIKGITEQTADLLASYINAIRADVSVNRNMIAQYFPLYYTAMTSGNENLRNIENHTAAIMRSNDSIAQSVSELQSDIRGLRNKAWKVPMA